MKMPNREVFLFAAFLILLLRCPGVIAQDGAGREVLTRQSNYDGQGRPSAQPHSREDSSFKNKFQYGHRRVDSPPGARVPTEIINAMVEASTHASAVTSSTEAGDVSKADPNDPASAHEAENPRR